MLTVNLDQSKWIDLARAETGRPKGKPFVESLAISRQAVDKGRARFPLGTAHYYETGKQRGRTKHMELATTMVCLAGTLRIAPSHVIVPWELRRALVQVFDLPVVIPDLNLFGAGVAHAFAAPTLKYTAPAERQGIPLSPPIGMKKQDTTRTSTRSRALSAADPPAGSKAAAGSAPVVSG